MRWFVYTLFVYIQTNVRTACGEPNPQFGGGGGMGGCGYPYPMGGGYPMGPMGYPMNGNGFENMYGNGFVPPENEGHHKMGRFRGMRYHAHPEADEWGLPKNPYMAARRGRHGPNAGSLDGSWGGGPMMGPMMGPMGHNRIPMDGMMGSNNGGGVDDSDEEEDSDKDLTSTLTDSNSSSATASSNSDSTVTPIQLGVSLDDARKSELMKELSEMTDTNTILDITNFKDKIMNIADFSPTSKEKTPSSTESHKGKSTESHKDKSTETHKEKSTELHKDKSSESHNEKSTSSMPITHRRVTITRSLQATKTIRVTSSIARNTSTNSEIKITQSESSSIRGMDKISSSSRTMQTFDTQSHSTSTLHIRISPSQSSNSTNSITSKHTSMVDMKIETVSHPTSTEPINRLMSLPLVTRYCSTVVKQDIGHVQSPLTAAFSCNSNCPASTVHTGPQPPTYMGRIRGLDLKANSVSLDTSVTVGSTH